MEARNLIDDTRFKQILRAMGYSSLGHMYSTSSVSILGEERILEMPVDTRNLFPLRNPDGTINYPVDFLPVDSSPSS